MPDHLQSGRTPDPLSAVSVKLPQDASLASLLSEPARQPFDPEAVSFVASLGRSLRSSSSFRPFPELVALGFWARRATLQRLQKNFTAAYPGQVRLARGVAFHIAPANVDTIFVYSLLLSLLAGNVNIVRISSRNSPLAEMLLSVMQESLGAASPELSRAMGVVQYEHDELVTDAISSRCDLRIVWGGDSTVAALRRSPLPPTAVELAFPNRFSLAVIDAGAWLRESGKDAIARRFVNDSLWFGQMACSSPRALIWRGNEEQALEASATFWPLVESAAQIAGLPWEDAAAIQKLAAEQDAAITQDAQILPSATNLIRVVRKLDLATLGHLPGAAQGYFEEYRINRLADLMQSGSDDWQTVVSHGISEEDWRSALVNFKPRGFHRIVRIGQALDFDSIWDGVDLLAGMTRIVSISVESSAPESV